MAMSAQDRVKRYQSKCDAIMIRPPKETGQAIRAAAAEAGLPLQRYILQAIQQRIERDRHHTEYHAAGE